MYVIARRIAICLSWSLLVRDLYAIVFVIYDVVGMLC